MDYPDGFKDLVQMAKKSPVKKLQGTRIWEKFCEAVMIGKGRSEPEIRFLSKLLKKQFDHDYVHKTSEFAWHDQVEQFLRNRLDKIRDAESKTVLLGVLRDLTYIASSLKEGANFFEKHELLEKIDDITETGEKTWNLIEEIVEKGRIPGIGYVKAILWLQSTGRARGFAPPTRHLKSFINSDIGPYYQYYEDDDYFMEKAQEVGKDFRNTDLMDIYRAIFAYRSVKSLMPRGSGFTPKKLVTFMKKKKLSFEKFLESMADADKKEKLLEEIFNSC